MAGVVAQSPYAFAYVADMLVPEDFYDERHARIWRAASTLTGVPALVDWDPETITLNFNVRVAVMTSESRGE